MPTGKRSERKLKLSFIDESVEIYINMMRIKLYLYLFP